jgi:hypothetical protein
MPERDAHDDEQLAADRAAPHTPRVSGDVRSLETPLPKSGTHEAAVVEDPAVASEPGDTLLSAGKPADRLELLLEDKLARVDDRLRELDDRLAVLEQKRTTTRAPEPRPKPWLWLVFLVLLVVIFQLLRRVH